MTLDEFKKLTEEATPGPWWSDSITVTNDTHSGLSSLEHGHFASVENSHVEIASFKCGLSDVDIREVTTNADFIAACRAMVPRLIAVAEAAIWISRLDMDPEDHKSYRKFDRLQQALSALNQSAAIIPAK